MSMCANARNIGLTMKFNYKSYFFFQALDSFF